MFRHAVDTEVVPNWYSILDPLRTAPRLYSSEITTMTCGPSAIATEEQASSPNVAKPSGPPGDAVA